MEVVRIAEGLWRWTTTLPGRPDDVVASAFVDTGAEIALIDPLVPAEPDEAERFWRALDRDVERAGAPPSVLLTSYRHARSAAAVAGRYEGAVVLSPAAAPEEALARTVVRGSLRAGDRLPAGIEAHATADPAEIVFVAQTHRALIVGDILVGAAGGLRSRAPSRLPGGVGADEVAESLRPLLALPVEIVLPSHGEPVLAGGRASLAAALEALGG